MNACSGRNQTASVQQIQFSVAGRVDGRLGNYLADVDCDVPRVVLSARSNATSIYRETEPRLEALASEAVMRQREQCAPHPGARLALHFTGFDGPIVPDGQRALLHNTHGRTVRCQAESS